MGRRQERVGKLMLEELGVIFQQMGQSTFGNPFITVSNVRMTPDLGYAKVFLSAMNEKEPERMLATVREHKKEIRHALGQRIRNQLKKVPELHFYYDDSMDYAERMDKLFKNIDTGKDDEDEQNDESSNTS